METMTMTEAKTLILETYLEKNGGTRPGPATYGQFEVTIPGPYSTLDAMERAHARQGGHYFDRDAKRFFRSRVYDQAFYGRFFIDSIQFESSRGERAPRQYKIRAVLDNGQTSSVIARDASGNWCEDFPTLDSAKRAIKRLVEEA